MSSICGSESSYHILQIVLPHEASDCIVTHQIKHTHNYFILFVSSGLGMYDILNSQWRLRHLGALVKEMNTVLLI